MDTKYDKVIDISMLSEGIWFISKEANTLLARKLNDLPKAVVAAQLYPVQNDLCLAIRAFLKKILPKDTFDDYIIQTKAVLRIYELILRELTKHELTDEDTVKQICESIDMHSPKEEYQTVGGVILK